MLTIVVGVACYCLGRFLSAQIEALLAKAYAAVVSKVTGA